MIRSTFAASASPRGARRSLGWLLLAGLTLPLAIVQAGAPSTEHRIGGSEVSSRSIELAAGDFVGAVVEQDGIDLLVSLFDPQGKAVLEMDSPDDWAWEEELAWEAEQPGTYRLAVRPLDPNAAPGLFRIRVDGPRPARPEDRTRVQAVREMRAALDDYGRSERRLEHLEKALVLWSELGDRRREAETLHQIGAVFGDMKRSREASERFSQAAAVWQELGVLDKQAWSLLEHGRAEQDLLHIEEARQSMEQGLALALRAQDPGAEALARYYQGRFYLKQDPRTAFGYLSQALPLARRARNTKVEMRILYHLGYASDDLAEPQDALQYYQEAMTLSRQLRDAGYEFNCLNSLGLTYFSLGHRERAAELCRQALDVAPADMAVAKKALALNNLALMYESSDPVRAREFYNRSLALGLQAGDPEVQSLALVNLAFLEIRTGDPAKALDLGCQALALNVGNVEVSIHHALGLSLRKLNDLKGSRKELETALGLSRRRHDRVRESLIIPELARTVRQAGDLRTALSLLESGIGIVESVRTKVEDEQLRATFLASRQGLYELYTDTLMALHRAEPGQGHDAEALQASERARARSLLDILVEAGADVREEAAPALIEQERRMRAEIEALETRRLRLLDTGGSSQEISEQLGALLEEYHKVESSLRASSPRYAALTQPQTLSVAEIQDRVLDGRALLLEYALGEDRSFLWAVHPDGIRSFELPPRATIEDAARRYYQALNTHPNSPEGKTAQAALEKAADELSRMLLEPVAPLLQGQPLLVVSDGALQYVPFAPLPSPSSLGSAERVPLIAGHEVVSLPSASTLAVLRRELAGRPAPPKTLAVLADPVFQSQDERVTHKGANGRRSAANSKKRKLPEGRRSGEVNPGKLTRLAFSKDEADAIAGLVAERDRLKALDFKASRATATGGELARYRMVHFATHGLIDSRRPELSSLVLSLVDEKGQPQNGFLRLHDIYNLELNADLVVLSACQTALGQEIRGEGLVGLTRGFMYAGAARVMSSLWSVDDRATAELMKAFYRSMISDRKSPAAALREAQGKMARHPRWKSPYYWAGFSLQGEWR